jgi:hypothetical protein
VKAELDKVEQAEEDGMIMANQTAFSNAESVLFCLILYSEILSRLPDKR